MRDRFSACCQYEVSWRIQARQGSDTNLLYNFNLTDGVYVICVIHRDVMMEKYSVKKWGDVYCVSSVSWTRAD